MKTIIIEAEVHDEYETDFRDATTEHLNLLINEGVLDDFRYRGVA